MDAVVSGSPVTGAYLTPRLRKNHNVGSQVNGVALGVELDLAGANCPRFPTAAL